MANPEHVAIVKQGAAGIEAWRKLNPLGQLDLSGANLRMAQLPGADLRGADLSGVDLYAATLSGANLSGADLYVADLREVDLCQADLSGANMSGADLTGADLTGARFANSKCVLTVFSDVDLSDVVGLETITHKGPSRIGVDTLFWSKGKIPEAFLRGAGVPEVLIEYLGSLTGTALEFYSCFISYSHLDRAFARRLHDALQGRGIRCWLDEHQLLPGDPIRDRITEGIKVWDKVLFCVSQSSLTSWWVDKELTIAFAKEEQLSKQAGRKVHALIPLNLDGSLFTWDSGWGDEVRSRLAADFTGWEQDNAKFEAQFDRVVKALRSDEGARPNPPAPKLGKEKV